VLLTYPGESYRMWCECYREASIIRWPRPTMGCYAMGIKTLPLHVLRILPRPENYRIRPVQDVVIDCLDVLCCDKAMHFSLCALSLTTTAVTANRDVPSTRSKLGPL
jgi:hypothetical protein